MMMFPRQNSGFTNFCIFFIIFYFTNCLAVENSNDTKKVIDRIFYREKAKELFLFGYENYMKIAFPHDELMPIACEPRIRGITPSRGDVDDALGNFSLTLIDSLDTLVVIGEYDEFESAVKKVIKTVRFDSDFTVSVFETNIRMVGGLISAHVMAKMLQTTHDKMLWYNDELLKMTIDLADRLLPAFNTTSGLPHPRVNLKHGMLKYLKNQVDTCTACGGTMILEMAALSRLTGNKIYEEKAKKAMDFLWTQRNHGSDLVGTVLNVENGNWIRREAGIGAGIDSYVEYSLKAYILLGEEDYLYRFNKHYDAIMRYVNKGPLFIDVHMHKPNVASRPYMDSLLAFWPGLQVLKGDLKSAIEIHEMLYQVVQKYKFLPEAFTHDFQIHWAQHPIRPEFVESTYLLYRATRDQHYLNVAITVMESIEKYTKVKCGFAGIKDLRSMEHEDRMDSFVLAETFKYLYLIFSEPNELPFDPDNYVLTTEAHFLPLTIGENLNLNEKQLPRKIIIDPNEIIGEETIKKYQSACPNYSRIFKTTDELTQYGSTIRNTVKKLLTNVVDGKKDDDTTCAKTNERLRAWAFSTTNAQHLSQLKMMGIEVEIGNDGRVLLTHHAHGAKNNEMQEWGLEFMKEMIMYSKQLEQELFNLPRVDRIVQLIFPPYFGTIDFPASSANFGMNLNDTNNEVIGEILFTNPGDGCEEIKNSLIGKIALINRGNCMFHEKARFAQNAGAIGVIILDNQHGSSFETSPLFTMSGDNTVDHDIEIPIVLLFQKEVQKMMEFSTGKNPIIRIAAKSMNPKIIFEKYLKNTENDLKKKCIQKNKMIELMKNEMKLSFYFGKITEKSTSNEIIKIVDENMEIMNSFIKFKNSSDQLNFIENMRRLAYWAFGYDLELDPNEIKQLKIMMEKLELMEDLKIKQKMMEKLKNLEKDARIPKVVTCYFGGNEPKCERMS